MNMTTVEENKSHRIISDYNLFAVRFNIKQSGTNRALYPAVVNIVGHFKTREADLYRTAEEAARSWGAFADPAAPLAMDHHFYDREFEPVSIEKMGQVDGVMMADAKLLADFKAKRNFD
jgi:hypothetical protein